MGAESGSITGLLRGLWPFFAIYRWQLTLIVLTLMVDMAMSAGFPLGLKALIDHALLERNGRLLVIILSILGSGVVAVSTIGFFRDRLYSRVAAEVLSLLRMRMFNHLQSLSMDFYARSRMGEILSRFSSDLAGIESLLATVMPWGVLPLLEVAAGTGLLFFLDVRLALIAMFIWPLSLLGPRMVTPIAMRSSYEKKKLESVTLSAIQESVMAQPIVKAFGLEVPMIADFSRHNTNLFKSSVRFGFLSSLVERSAGTSILLLNVVIIGVGALRVFQGHLSVGSFVSFETVFLTLSYSLSYLSQYVPSVIQAAGSMKHIEGLLTEQPGISDRPDAKPIPRFSRELVFDDVSFSYQGDRLDLEHVNLRIEYGSFVAFIGTSGSGKSTILNLLLRFYDPRHGSLLVDGHDLRRVTQESWRSQIAVVFQDSFLFDTTMRENIRMGNPQATDREVEDAARAAEIHDFIVSLPRGYDSRTGDRGSSLSGGQRQRLAIARAILRNPAILVLDEATSALDPASESAINETLTRLARTRTVIAVTHRLRSVKRADQTFVLHGGRIVEQGKHQELLDLQGLYNQLWQKQQAQTAQLAKP